jgi:hypothetical protein
MVVPPGGRADPMPAGTYQVRVTRRQGGVSESVWAGTCTFE